MDGIAYVKYIANTICSYRSVHKTVRISLLRSVATAVQYEIANTYIAGLATYATRIHAKCYSIDLKTCGRLS